MRRPPALLAVLALAACGPSTTPGGPTLPPPEPVPLAEGPG